MQYQRNRTWMEVSLDDLEYNFRLLSDLIGPSCAVMGVIKGNACGLGAVRVAQELQTAGCRFFGAATLEEAVELRDAGIIRPILLLGVIDFAYVSVCLDYRVTLPVLDLAYAAALSDLAHRRGRRLDVHLKVDTGLSRYGIPLDKDMDGALQQAMNIATLPGLALRGVFTHVACAGDPKEDDFTLRQFTLFRRFTEQLAASGLRLTRHCANSPVTLRFPQERYELVRTATILYGFNVFQPDFPLREVASLKTRIIATKEMNPGDSLSYDRLFTAERKTRIGLVPFGYGDGLPRLCTNRAFFLVRGKKARVVGKLCMDLCFIDITDIPEVREGDMVTVFGRDGDAFQSVFDIVNLYPGSAPELTAVLGRRIPRFYLRDGFDAGRD
jgi:alanine racemase